MAAFDKGYIEIYEYPRAQEAIITYTEDGSKEVVKEGFTEDAILYEIIDMEKAVSQDNDMYIQYTVDVMKIMTDIRKKWQMYYPEEEN